MSFGGLGKDQKNFEKTKFFQVQDLFWYLDGGQKPTRMESAFSKQWQFQITYKTIASALLALCSDHYLLQGGNTTHP